MVTIKTKTLLGSGYEIGWTVEDIPPDGKVTIVDRFYDMVNPPYAQTRHIGEFEIKEGAPGRQTRLIPAAGCMRLFLSR